MAQIRYGFTLVSNTAHHFVVLILI